MKNNIKIFTNNIEPAALEQVYSIAALPAFKTSKIRIMPDVHPGENCIIGFTSSIEEKIIPNIVGIDIGCGMYCVKLKEKEIDFKKLDEVVYKYVPNGRELHDRPPVNFPELDTLFCRKELRRPNHIMNSIGTLGGGNHFIEVDKDDREILYLIIHSGSRFLGREVCEYYQNRAIEIMQGYDDLEQCIKKEIDSLKSAGQTAGITKTIEHMRKEFTPKKLGFAKEMCFLEGEWKEKYLHDMKICQTYAVMNRKTIAETILSKCGLHAVESFETIHNYIDHDANIVRKGAISAQKGEKVLIPINMRDGCIIGRGKGNEDWNFSAPHGAGRCISRSEAKELIDVDEYVASMEGIYTTSAHEGTLDEAPDVYKPMNEILENVKDTIHIETIIKPIYSFKASSKNIGQILTK